jgi:DNA-binding Lrp family transcriptional regulator
VSQQSTGEMTAKLRHLPEVESVELVTGPSDLIVRMRVQDHERLRDVLFNDILPLDGVHRTNTFISLASMEAKNVALELLDERRENA